MTDYFSQCGVPFDCVERGSSRLGLPTTVLFELVNAVILTAAIIHVQLEDRGRVKHKRDPTRKPRFGFGAGYVINFVAGLGLTFCVPPLVLYFAWHPFNTSTACLIVYQNLGFP